MYLNGGPYTLLFLYFYFLSKLLLRILRCSPLFPYPFTKITLQWMGLRNSLECCNFCIWILNFCPSCPTLIPRLPLVLPNIPSQDPVAAPQRAHCFSASRMWRQLKGGLKVDNTQFTCYRFVNSITNSKSILIKTQK